MFSFLILLKREISDHLGYLVAAIIVAALLITAIIPAIYQNDLDNSIGLIISITILAAIGIVIGLCAMGATQMYTDRSRKISAFLSTLPVTRSQILMARITAGLAVILIILVPPTVAASVILRVLIPSVPVFEGVVLDLSVGLILLAFSCYCLGLHTGWSLSKTVPTLGAIGFTAILSPIIIIKGVGPELTAILLCFITASLFRIRHKFVSDPL